MTLKRIRTILAVVMFVCITWLFVDFTGTAYQWFSWMPKIQLLEAILAVNVVAIAILVVGTLIFGRVYCSVIVGRISIAIRRPCLGCAIRCWA